MDHNLITEKNAVIRMLGREAIKPYLWLTVAGVCFFTVIMDIPNIIWSNELYTTEQLQAILRNLFEFGIYPTIPRFAYVKTLYTFLITGPLTYGLCSFLIKIFRRKPTTSLEIFLGFSNFLKTFLLYLLMTLAALAGLVLLVVPGVILIYCYSMSYYLMVDNPELGAVAAMKESRARMRGNKWKLFTLHLSFIGWMILSAAVTTFLSAVSPWLSVIVDVFVSALLSAYIRLSEVAFYEMLVGHLHRLNPEEANPDVN